MSTNPIPTDVAEAIEADGFNLEAVQAYVDNAGVQLGTAEDWHDIATEFEDSYLGEFDNERQWVEDQACELGLTYYDGSHMCPRVVQSFFSWIDWDQIVYDYQCSGEFWWERSADMSTVHVFRAY